jgi:hypothetical protein
MQHAPQQHGRDRPRGSSSSGGSLSSLPLKPQPGTSRAHFPFRAVPSAALEPRLLAAAAVILDNSP